jgi:hypothetical protein
MAAVAVGGAGNESHAVRLADGRSVQRPSVVGFEHDKVVLRLCSLNHEELAVLGRVGTSADAPTPGRLGRG